MANPMPPRRRRDEVARCLMAWLMTVAGVASTVHAGGDILWSTSVGGNGHWFAFVPDVVSSWNDCRNRAIAMGGELWVPETAEEHAFVAGAIADDDSAWIGQYGAFIGVLQLADAGEPAGGWITLSAESPAVTFWKSYEPNNDSGGAGPEDVVQLERAGGNLGWNDVTSAGGIGAGGVNRIVPGFVIEWSADCNDDGIVDHGQILSGELRDDDENGIPDACPSGPGVGGTLLRNGSFELGPALDDCTWSVIASGDKGISDWYVTAGEVDRVRLSGACDKAESWESFDGEYTIDLCGFNTCGTLVQEIETTPGRRYRIDWWATNNTGGPAGDSDKRGGIAFGLANETFTVSGGAEWPQPWNQFQTIATARSSLSILTFTGIDGVSNGVVIDGVIVTDLSATCPGDLDDDGDVDATDLGVWLTYAGTECEPGLPCPGDLDGDGEIRGSDLGLILLQWGLCD